MAYAWADLFYDDDTPNLLCLHAAAASGEDLTSIRSDDGSMSILDGLCFFKEWDFIEDAHVLLSMDDSRVSLLDLKSTLVLTRQCALLGIPVVRKLTWKDFVTRQKRNTPDIDAVIDAQIIINHRRVLIAIAAGRGPVLRHLCDAERKVSLLDVALQSAGRGGWVPECEYLCMVSELVSAQVPLGLLGQEYGWPTPLESLFFEPEDPDSESIDSQHMEPGSWPPRNPKPHLHFRQRLGAVIAAGLTEQVQLLEGPGNESYVNTHFVKMVLTDASIGKTSECIGLLRKLGATTRLAIGDVRHALQAQMRKNIDEFVALGVDRPEVVRYDEESLWRHAVMWHRCQEASAKLTFRTLSVCLPSNAVDMVDAFLLGERVPLYQDSLRIGTNKNPEYFDDEGEYSNRENSSGPNEDGWDGNSNAEHEPRSEVGGQGMGAVGEFMPNTEDVGSVIEQIEHTEPPAWIPSEEASLVAACQYAGLVERMGPSMSSDHQASGYAISIAALNRNTKAIRKELSEGISLRHHRRMIEAEGHVWKLRNGAFVFVDPMVYRQVIVKLKDLEPELTPSHVIFSKSAEPNLEEALRICNGCLKDSLVSMPLDGGCWSDVATIGNDDGDMSATVCQDGFSTFTLEVVRTFICAVPVDVGRLGTTKSTTDLYCFNPRHAPLSMLAD